MDIWDTNKLTLFVAFVVPGFISIKTYSLLFLSLPKDTSSQLIDAVAYSCLNYAIFYPLYFYVNSVSPDGLGFGAHSIFLFLTLFVGPVLWVFLWRCVRDWEFLQKWLPHPVDKPWDFVFGQRVPFWIIVTLKDGRKIAGLYGLKSFASAAPSKEQIYFEQTWELNEDGGFERPREATAGTLIVTAEIESMEFFQCLTEDEK